MKLLYVTLVCTFSYFATNAMDGNEPVTKEKFTRNGYRKEKSGFVKTQYSKMYQINNDTWSHFNISQYKNMDGNNKNWGGIKVYLLRKAATETWELGACEILDDNTKAHTFYDKLKSEYQNQ